MHNRVRQQREYQRTYLGTVNGVDERLHTGSVTGGSALDQTLSATESGRGPKWTRRQSELFDRLVDLFLIEGFADLTLEDIAGRLRCSKSTLYALAHSKEQLAVAVVTHFFRRAASRVEKRVLAAGPDPRARVVAYLTAVADELRPASPDFQAAIADFPPGRAVYERNTRIAADRVRALIAEGVASGAFRDAHAEFVGEVAAVAMAGIQRGDVTARTGLTDAEAYAELATLVLHGVSA